MIDIKMKDLFEVRLAGIDIIRGAAYLSGSLFRRFKDLF